MTNDALLFAVHVAVAVLIVVIQVSLLWWAKRLAWVSGEDGLERYRSRFSADLIGRARRGQSPDWMYYRVEIERLFDVRDERLRVLAAAALATGLGGTMLALLVTFLVHQGDLTTATGPLIRGLGVALFGSLAGVFNHLVIILGLLPFAEDRFTAAADKALDELRSASLQNSPVELFTKTFHEELSALRQSLSTEFGKRLSESITDLPQAVTALGAHMDRLGEVVEAQARNADSAVQDIKICSELVAQSSANLLPTARQLAESADRLVDLPEQLGSVLKSGRQEWVDRLHEEQKKARDELFRQVRLLQENSEERERALQDVVTGVRETLSTFPEHLAEEVKGMFADLQTGLAQELGGYTNALGATLKEDHDRLVRTVIQDWENNVSTVARSVLDEIASEVDGRLVGPLNEVTQELAMAVAELPKVAVRLETAHGEWQKVHEHTLASWSAAGESITAAAEKLSTGNAQLGQAVSALRDGAGQLERVAHATNGFEDSLHKVLREAAEQQYQHLQPLHDEIGKVIEQMRGHYDLTLSEQSTFIRNLIEQVLRKRGSLRQELEA